MKVFVAWSGGKDCMLALHRILKEKEHEVVTLVNMCSADGQHSGSHGLRKEIIQQQATELAIPIIQQAVDDLGYEHNLKQVIKRLKQQGVSAGVFGDIYLQAHRDWIDRVCSEMEIEAIYPLWHENTNDLLHEFTSEGFESLVVSVNADLLDKKWLGRQINSGFFKEITKLKNIDACAENGEYHSFVFNGPILKNKIQFTCGDATFEKNHWLLPLKMKQHV